MASPRKKWSTTIPIGSTVTSYRRSHASQAATYRWIQARAAEHAAGMLPDSRTRVIVWVDERDGRGWQRFEDLDLAELTATRP